MSNATLSADLLAETTQRITKRIEELEFALSMTENCLRSHNMVIAFENGLCLDIEGNRVTGKVVDILKAPRVERSQAEAVLRADIRNGNGEQATLRFDRDVLMQELATARDLREWLASVAA